MLSEYISACAIGQYDRAERILRDIQSGAASAGPLLLRGDTLPLADHHIIPAFRGNSKSYADFVRARGIDVDLYTVTLAHGEASHHLKFIHGQRRWNRKWMDFIDTHPDATAKDIFQFAGKMMDEFGLSGLEIHPYGK